MDEEFEVVFHHGGKFISDGKLRYEYGKVLGYRSTQTCGATLLL